MIFYSHRRFRKWVFRGIVGLVLASIVILAADFGYGLVTADRPPAQVDINYYYNIIGSQKVVALTFDDGPSPSRTQAIMETLKRENVPATFFFIGSRALRYPNLVKEAADNGFEIGNHSFTHAQEVQTSRWRLRWELNLTDTIIEAVTHQTIRLYRPPFLLDVGGDPTTTTGSKQQLSWATNDGYVVVGADVDPKDWLANSSDQVVDDLIAKIQNGGHLVLLHDGSSERYTVAALSKLIKELRSRGYTFATAGQLLGLDAAKEMVVSQDVRLGSVDATSNNSVSALQTFLITEGFPVNDQKGVFGAATQNALKAWQERHAVRGERDHVGPATRTAIQQTVNQKMYQQLPTSRFSNISIFNGISGLYIALAPLFSVAIVWIVRAVLVLVALRLALTLILRSIVALRPKREVAPWTGRVSVIIPAYNEEDNIGATVESVLNSTFENLEVLVINDGSKDKTAEIVHKIELKNSKKVRLYNLKNGGKARALNYGLRLAHNDVVVTMDGDTIFDRYTISRLVRHFNDPTVAAVAGKVCVTRSRNLLNQFQAAEYIITQNMDKQALNLFNAVGVVPGPVGAWRKSQVLAAGGYSLDTLVEDQDLTMALLAAGQRVVYEPQANAYTETPFKVKDFFKQRSRWIFGTVQCLWKYKRYFLSVRRPALGIFSLPNTLFFSILLSLLIPLMDILLITTLMSGLARSTIILYLIFAAVDFTYAGLAFSQEKTKRWLIWLLPIQRLFYRVVIFLVVWRSVIKAIEGAAPHWNKVRKRGDALAYHVQMMNDAAPAPQSLTVTQSKVQ